MKVVWPVGKGLLGPTGQPGGGLNRWRLGSSVGAMVTGRWASLGIRLPSLQDLVRKRRWHRCSGAWWLCSEQLRQRVLEQDGGSMGLEQDCGGWNACPAQPWLAPSPASLVPRFGFHGGL